MAFTNKISLLAGVSLTAVLIYVPPTLAQDVPSKAQVVAACGTPASTYTAGQIRPQTQDTTGKICTSSSGGGGGGNDAASATGAAVPADADYQGLNVGGTLRGNTGVNPTGSVYAAQTDTTSIAGTTTSVGAGAVGTGSQRVAVGQDTTTVAGAAPTTTGIYVTGPSAAALATAANQTSEAALIVTTNTLLNNTQGTKAAGTAASNSQLTGGVYNSTPPTLTNGQQAATQFSAAGRLLVDAAITGGGDASAANQTVVQGVIGAATAPTKMNVSGGVYNSTPITLTNGQSSAAQYDANGYQKVNVVAGSNTGVAQGSTTSGQTVTPMGCRTLTSAPTDTTAQTNMPSCDTAGALRVNVTSATGVAQGSTTSGQSISPIGCRTLTSAPTDTTAQTNIPWCRTNGAQAQDLASINGTTIVTGTGAQTSGSPRVTVATDTATIAGSAPGTAGSASSNVLTIQGVASMTPVQASLTGLTTGGATAYGLQAAASTNSTSVKGSAGTLAAMNLINTTTTIYYLRMYNASSAPTCSSATNFVRTWPIPPAPAAGQAGGIAVNLGVNGTAFSTGIAFCVTGGPSSTDNTNAATGVFINLDYF